MTTAALSRISGVHPLWAVEGGRVTISGDGLLSDERPPEVRVGTIPARVAFASPHAVTVIVPSGLDGGHTPIRLESAPGETAYVEVGAPIATGLHLVDNPVFDPDGNLYVTFSGSRGQQATVAVYRVRPDGTPITNYYVNESVGIACGLFIAALHEMGLVTLTHTPSPMKFLNELLDRPDNERPFLVLVVGYPDEPIIPPVKPEFEETKAE